MDLLLVPLLLVVLVWVPVDLAARAVRRFVGSTGWALRDRAELISAAGSATTALAVLRVLGPWTVVPPWLWTLAVAVALFGLVTGLACWPALPATRPGARPVLRWSGPVASLALGVTVLTLTT